MMTVLQYEVKVRFEIKSDRIRSIVINYTFAMVNQHQENNTILLN